jgi:tryptophan 2,3-dioxygenase
MPWSLEPRNLLASRPSITIQSVSDELKTGAIDLTGEKIHWDLEGGMTYASYLKLEKVLGAQTPISGHHDETLFIIIHQVSELWMKLSLHELRAVARQIQEDDLDPAFKMLARVARIQSQLIHSWDVLSTMTPFDYASFRGELGRSSGFQSYQYRMLEFVLGNKNRELIEVHRSDEKVYEALRQELARPSLWDESLRLLSRRKFDIPSEYVERDWAEPYVPHPKVEAAWLAVYRDVTTHWDLYELAEKLVDLEQKFQQWRFNHMKTVERIIGYKRGTGGTSGVGYLQKVLGLKFFPELWSVRTSI